MANFGKGIRCDSCGKFSSHPDGYYKPKDNEPHPYGCMINAWGRECEHDYCDVCEQENEKNGGKCPKCGAVPNSPDYR